MPEDPKRTDDALYHDRVGFRTSVRSQDPIAPKTIRKARVFWGQSWSKYAGRMQDDKVEVDVLLILLYIRPSSSFCVNFAGHV